MKWFLSCVLCCVGGHAADSCFGSRPDYDVACSKFKTESACDGQYVCRWGDATKDDCFAKDSSDPGAVKFCTNLTNMTACNNQVACAWHSPVDVGKWVASIRTAVNGLSMDPGQVPATVSLGTPTMSSSHDHQVVDASRLQATLSAWKTKYGLPDAAIQALSALVAAETAEYKSIDKVIQDGESGIQLVAAGGRNYNGDVTIAFVAGTSSSTLTKKPNSVACSGSKCKYEQLKAGRCIVDGVDSHVECEREEHCKQCHRSCTKWAVKCGGIPSDRALTADEATAINHMMQGSLFPKINSEATLLENELSQAVVQLV